MQSPGFALAAVARRASSPHTLSEASPSPLSQALQPAQEPSMGQLDHRETFPSLQFAVCLPLSSQRAETALFVVESEHLEQDWAQSTFVGWKEKLQVLGGECGIFTTEENWSPGCGLDGSPKVTELSESKCKPGCVWGC